MPITIFRTLMVSLLASSIDVGEEVIDQPIDAGELVRLTSTAYVPMWRMSGLIVVEDHHLAVGSDVCQPIVDTCRLVRSCKELRNAAFQE
jgi:hypothetical protein